MSTKYGYNNNENQQPQWSLPESEHHSESQSNILENDVNQKAEQYTTAVGSYCERSLNVDLGPPLNYVPVPQEDEHILNSYEALQYSLYENNFPETVDRTSTPQTYFTENDVCITILSSPVECLTILLEGGMQCPADMLLVMSCSWITKRPSKEDPSLYSLYVSKAISFDSGRNTFLDVFEPPRKATYFLNYFTKGMPDGQRDDGDNLELDIDCPMSRSLQLVKITDDKLLTYQFAAKVNVDYPECIAFTYQPKNAYDIISKPDLLVVELPTRSNIENLILSKLQTFLDMEIFRTKQKIVVEPFGSMWHGSVGVSYHDSDKIGDILKAVMDLSDKLTAGDYVLVAVFYYSPSQTVNTLQGDLSFGICSTVCRGFNNIPVVSSIICGIGDKNQPINGDNTVPQTFKTTLNQFGISDETEIKRLEDLLKLASINIFEEITAFENKLNVGEKRGRGAQSDLIGLVFVLGTTNNELNPILIDVNSHINSKQLGTAVRPFVQTMVHRSQKFIMEGKTVLIVGAGNISKEFIWPAANDYHIRIVLVEKGISYASSQVHKFLSYDFSDHLKDTDHATNIIELLQNNGIYIDGCSAYSEDNAPLSAIISSKLNLNGPGDIAANIAKNKSRTQQTLLTRTADIPHFPRTYLYASECFPVTSINDISTGLEKVGLPAVLKLEYGSKAVGTFTVNDVHECRKRYEYVQETLRNEKCPPGVGLGFGNSMALMTHLKGTEHDIDIIIFQQRLVVAYVSDNGPTQTETLRETSSSMPTCLAKDKIRLLITAAYQCCIGIGLASGVFNVEMMMTTTGPKLIEINARMAGFYYRDWIKSCFGVDMLLCSFMTCVGVRPIVPEPKPQCHIMGIMCLMSVHKATLIDPLFISQMESDQGIRYNVLADYDENVATDVEEPVCSIAIESNDLQSAKSKLLKLCDRWNLSTENYHVKNFLVHFKN